MAEKKFTKQYERTFRTVTPETFGRVRTSSSPEKYYPSFSVPIDNIPQAKDWEVGKTYKLALEVIQKAIRLDEKKKEVTFEIRKIKSIT